VAGHMVERSNSANAYASSVRCQPDSPKKNSGAASRARETTNSAQPEALSDVDSMHARFFGSRGGRTFLMQIQCTRAHRRAAAAASGRRRALGSASAAGALRKKKIPRGARRPRANG